MVPLDYAREKHLHGSLGDIELGLKYRLVHQRAGSILPDIAILPTLLLPTGVPHRHVGEGGLFLPVWLQKDFGAWSWFGGGGYAINIGKARQNSWTLGTAVTRQLGERFNLGAEIYHETAETRSDQAVTGINAGFVYKISEHYGLALSGGPEWTGDQAGAAFYAAGHSNINWCRRALIDRTNCLPLRGKPNASAKYPRALGLQCVDVHQRQFT